MSDEQGYWTTSKNACKVFGVTANTIRRWADCNKITYKRTPSNQRIYFIPSTIDQSNYSKIQTKQNVIYCRVSSAKQKDDLQRQCLYLSSKYPDYKIIKDIGSGLNYKRYGLLKLLEMSNKQHLDTVVISSKDRLCRFGFELIEWQFLQNNTKILVLDQENKTPEQEFTEDILAILQIFAYRWNGKRKYTNGTIIKNEKNKIEIELDPIKNIKNVG